MVPGIMWSGQPVADVCIVSATNAPLLVPAKAPLTAHANGRGSMLMMPVSQEKVTEGVPWGRSQPVRAAEPPGGTVSSAALATKVIMDPEVLITTGTSTDSGARMHCADCVTVR